MAIYTVHVPDESADRVGRADRTVFVREGFNAWALVFGVLFLLWHRLWVAAAVWFGFALALGGVCWVLHAPAATFTALAGLMHLFVGVEGNDLRRWALERRGLRCAEVVSGGGLDEAELAFFHRQASPSRPAPRPAPPSGPSGDATPAVIGMFPDGMTR